MPRHMHASDVAVYRAVVTFEYPEHDSERWGKQPAWAVTYCYGPYTTKASAKTAITREVQAAEGVAIQKPVVTGYVEQSPLVWARVE